MGDKLSKLRKENNYTQEQLAGVLGVSRQAISKWESNLTYPETDKLIRISALFDCSLDYLLGDAAEEDRRSPDGAGGGLFRVYPRERKSERTVRGMPLWHIGRNARGFIAVGLHARGVVAVGLRAEGVVSLGMLSVGVVSFGMLSLGLLAFGLLALGVLSAGCFSVGVCAAGAVSLGIISCGAVAIGDFSVGALAVGKYFALGDHAQAGIALGDTQAAGSVFEKTGARTAQDVSAVKMLLDTTVPAQLAWAKALVKLAL
ncbi:MAG: helix-turn-helix domain-containing protein [Hominenteromicrobium sp.]